MEAVETTINEVLVPEFLKKLERLNKRAAKLGMAPVTARQGEAVAHPVNPDTKPVGAYRALIDGKMRWVANYVTISITGEAPKIGGHTFMATVDLRGENPIVRATPSADGVDLSRFFTTDCHCDHCGSMRRRNDVLVLREDATGELIQIGRNCAADFFRSTNALGALQVSWWDSAADFQDDRESQWSSVRHEPTIPLEVLFTMAAAVVRTFGWVSRSMAMNDDTLSPTAQRTRNNLFPWRDMPEEFRATPTQEDVAEAALIIAWLLETFVGKPASERSQFEANVAAAIEGVDTGRPYVRLRNFNFLVWAVNGYRVDREKQLAKIEEAKARAAASKRGGDTHFGTVGERSNLVLSLKSRRLFGSVYGTRALCRFEDSDRNMIVWWGTSEDAFNMEVGESFVLKATIKAHGEYEGRKQTEITRVKVIEGKMKECAV